MRALVIIAALAIAAPAVAQTTLSQCTAHWPVKGGTFAGEARVIHDGDTACICSGPDPRTCVRTRFADFYAPELSEPGGRVARDALAQLLDGQRLVCVHHHASHRRSVAYCEIAGWPIGDLLRGMGVREGGRGR